MIPKNAYNSQTHRHQARHGVLTSGIGKLDTTRLTTLCDQVNALRQLGIEVILVSSGAVGLGMGKQLEKRPKDLATLLACAAVGQSILINNWQQCFDPHGLTVAQILLTREDLSARHRHNAVATLSGTTSEWCRAYRQRKRYGQRHRD